MKVSPRTFSFDKPVNLEEQWLSGSNFVEVYYFIFNIAKKEFIVETNGYWEILELKWKKH